MSFSKTKKKVDKGKNACKVSINTRVPRVRCKGMGTHSGQKPVSGWSPTQRKQMLSRPIC